MGMLKAKKDQMNQRLKGGKHHKRKRKNKNVESILVRISPTEKEERLHTQDKYITCKGHEVP